jgi:hypothetical protein
VYESLIVKLLYFSVTRLYPISAPVRAYMPAKTPDKPLSDKNFVERSIRDLMEASSE